MVNTSVYLDEKKQLLFQLLCVLADFCDKHNLKYYLCGGTLLGAVRHKDFIPWDDDLDVMMPRPDFQRLYKIVQNESIGGNYIFVDYRQGKSIFPFGKIIDKNITVRCRCNTADENLWLDIFPIDGIPEDERESEKLLKQAQFYKSMLSASVSVFFKGSTKLKSILKTPKLIFAHAVGHDYWCKKLNTLCNLYEFEKSDYVGGIAWSCGAGERMKKEEFLQSVEVEFHGQSFHAPACWHTYLQGLYGDYMTLPPMKQRYGHMMSVISENDDTGRKCK